MHQELAFKGIKWYYLHIMCDREGTEEKVAELFSKKYPYLSDYYELLLSMFWEKYPETQYPRTGTDTSTLYHHFVEIVDEAETTGKIQ